jgi:hypothetical protein
MDSSGHGLGIQTFPAKDSGAYKFISMSHSEYVSGTHTHTSSCFFGAVMELEHSTLLHTHKEPFCDFPFVPPPVEVGKSRREPVSVPLSTVQLIYPNANVKVVTVTDTAFAGGQSQSRLY